ncbi:co-chaperone GroES [uncultured Eubacterium sp.]|uniref:co-chaperone GroES n=1 Tax=uncultured Eubacterium sp. TaxID=165185 RepID=UPI00258BB8E9|nr:co-chaperone GroES [uncultured Eubacterium sp.]
MTIKPLADRVLLKQVKAEETTASGLILAASAQEKPEVSEVVAVGPGTEKDPMTVKVGDKVIISKYSGTQVKVDGEEYTITEVKEVLAVVE